MSSNSSISHKSKRRIAFTLLVLAILIINIIASLFIFLDIRLLETPEITIKADLIEVNPEELLIHHSLEIYNPNQFEIIVDNFEVVTNTKLFYGQARR